MKERENREAEFDEQEKREDETQANTKDPPTLREIIGSIVYYLLCSVLILIIICNLTIIIKGIFKPEEPPTMFGVAMLVDMSDCMYEIDKGDLIFIVHEDMNKLYKDDIISFMEGRTIRLGRIISENIEVIESGQKIKTGFIAKADNWGEKFDTVVNDENSIGLFRYRIPKLGFFILWAQTLPGILILVVIPLLLNFAYEYYLKRKHEKLLKEEAQEEENEETNEEDIDDV